MDAVEKLIERHHARKGAAAQICVIRHDEVVLERCWGCEPDALFLIYSSSKPFVALLVHLLAERGALDLDDPIAAHWPEFARNGKAAVTIRHALQHRAGIPVPGGLLGTLLHGTVWDKAIADIENARPKWPPGAVPAYHFLSFGFILGELVQRVTRRPLKEVLGHELLQPLGLTDIHLGLPDEALPRAVPVRAIHMSEIANQWVANRRRVRQSIMPAATISAGARQLARFYQMLLRGGELDGVRVLQPETILEARRPSSDGEIDAFIKRPVRWAQGFALGGPSADPRDLSRFMGGSSSLLAFGHAGNASCMTWADPTRGLALAYLSNLQPGIDGGLEIVGKVADAVLGAFG